MWSEVALVGLLPMPARLRMYDIFVFHSCALGRCGCRALEERDLRQSYEPHPWILPHWLSSS
eukprot:10102694-Alexandrium_andersonii.AAC.1